MLEITTKILKSLTTGRMHARHALNLSFSQQNFYKSWSLLPIKGSFRPAEYPPEEEIPSKIIFKSSTDASASTSTFGRTSEQKNGKIPAKNKIPRNSDQITDRRIRVFGGRLRLTQMKMFSKCL